MRSRAPMGTPRVLGGRWPAVALLVALFAGVTVFFADPAFAIITSITTRPEAPTACDPVGLLVKGIMHDPCHHLIGAEIRGPVELPTAGPIPTFEIRIRLTVQQPNPDLDIACPTVTQPYDHAFRLGTLSFGRYLVHATEYVAPFSPDSTADPTDSTSFEASFDVQPSASPCPGPDCFLLSFGATGNGAVDSTRFGVCNALGRPGGTGCFDISLMTGGRVGGVQTQVTILDRSSVERVPVPGEILHPIAVEAVGRARSFQVAWTADGSVLRVLLYSSTGGVIEPGDGPILHVCYEIGAGAPTGMYRMHFTEAIVADPAGNAIPHCPTFDEIRGTFCVGGDRGCDLNSDGATNISDIVLLVRCALSGGVGGTSSCPDPIAGNADCTGDGSIDIRDVICCVRGTLENGSFASATIPVGGPPTDPALTDVRFEGPVQWTSESTGWTMLQVAPGADVAGVQFCLAPRTTGARIRSISLESASEGVILESTTMEGGVKAILYRPAGDARLGGPARIRVEVEPTSGTVGQRYLSFVVEAADIYGRPARTVTSQGTSELPPTSAPALTAAAPNPFVSETEITYVLPASGPVSIRIFDATGRLVRTLVQVSMPSGTHRARWDGRDASNRPVASGVYFLKFSAGTVERTQRILKLR